MNPIIDPSDVDHWPNSMEDCCSVSSAQCSATQAACTGRASKSTTRPRGCALENGVLNPECRKINSSPAILQKPRSANSDSQKLPVSFHITASDSQPNNVTADSKMARRQNTRSGCS